MKDGDMLAALGKRCDPLACEVFDAGAKKN